MAFPDYYEEEGTRELTFNRRGAFGKKVWIAKWEYRFLAAPVLDTPFSAGYPRIRCNEITFTPMGQTGDGAATMIDNGAGTSVPDTADYTHCRITALYEYDVLTGDEPQVSGDCSTDIMNIAQGREWLLAKQPGTIIPCPVEEPTPVMIPGLAITYRIVRYTVPLAMIYNSTGKINSTDWENAPAETLLYEGATWDSDYDAQTGQLRYIVQHRFRWRYYSWNKVWRSAHVKVESDGSTIPNAQGFPIYDVQAGWDYPIDGDGQPLYRTADFNELML